MIVAVLTIVVSLLLTKNAYAYDCRRCGTDLQTAFLPDVPLNHGNEPLFCTNAEKIAVNFALKMQRPDVNAIYELPFDFPQKFQRVCCHIASFAHILGRDIFPLYPFINNSQVCQVWWNVWNIWLCIELVDLYSTKLVACDPRLISYCFV